jgi:uncharacterized repeat protein (TIGR01451 family)
LGHNRRARDLRRLNSEGTFEKLTSMLRFLFRRRLLAAALITIALAAFGALAVATATGAISPSQEGQPELTIATTADTAKVSASDQIGFTITVMNNGPGTANNLGLSDPLPDGTANGWSFHPAYPGPGACSITGPTADDQELDCSFGDLEEGASVTVHVVAETYFEDCDEYANAATASADNAASVQSSASIECLKPTLSVTKTPDQETVVAGDPIGFTITASNAGPGRARFVNLSDPLPAGTATPWSIDPSYAGPGVCSISGDTGNQELDCSFGNLIADHGATVHVTAETSVANCGNYDNTATATEYNGPDAQGSASVTCLPTKLTLTKTADGASVSAGDPIGFSITIENRGPSTALGVILKDQLPAGTAASGWNLDSNSGSAACAITGSVGGQDLDCPAIDMAAGTSYTVHLSAATSVASCTRYENTATASASNAAAASGSASVTCSAPQVSLTKLADHSAPVSAGKQIGFTVEVKNTGLGIARGVSLTDPLPAGSGAGVAWAIDGSNGTPGEFVLSGVKGSQTLSLGSTTLAAGADYKVHITAQTSETECSSYENTATLTARNAGNQVQASAEESCAYRLDLSITKSGAPARQTGLGNITWTMVVTNNGPDTDTGVEIADPIPAGNAFVSATTSQGSCTGGAILRCTIGAMAADAKVTISLVTTPSSYSSQTNTANVVGDRPDSNTANNAASATVVTVGPVTPPVFCVAVSRVTPKQLFVGRKTTLRIHVTRHNRAVAGIRVRITGPSLNVITGRSNHKGVIKHVVEMHKKGIVIFRPIASKRCNTKRIGVTNVFTPPVTG